MKEALKLLNQHASVRKFTGQEISEEDEQTIVLTAERSPTSSNLHAYSIISVRDSNKKEKLCELTGNQEHVKESSLFLVFCADMYRLKTLCDERGYEFIGDTTESLLIATVDASLAAARALIAAQALGLGGVMVGSIRNHPDQVCQLLDLPELVYPVMGMSLGYPESEPKIKPRLPIEGLCFKEVYDATAIAHAVNEYDETMAGLGYLEGREVEPEMYSDFDGRYSWAEHTARRMATQKPLGIRLHMMPFLQERGFMKR